MENTRKSKKSEIAKQINFEGKIYRTINVDDKLNLKEGQIYDNRGRVESWCNEYGTFNPEINGEYQYFFRCDVPVKGHEVDYENEEECEVLCAVGCEDECEVLILPSQKFLIKSVTTDEDFEEMGYYEVELEPVK